MSAQRFKYLTNYLLFLVIVFSAFIHLFKISEIPGEWFGDISIVHEYVLGILDGRWPFVFDLSNGPLYHYFALPLILFVWNQGFETYKLSSVGVGLVGIVIIYFMAKEIANKKIALITALITGCSFWYLAWSRLGNSQILIPPIASLMGYFIYKYYKKPELQTIVWASVTASLGWYIYPQTFVFVPIFIFFYSLFFFTEKKPKSLFEILVVGLVIIILSAPFFLFVIRVDGGNFGSQGYIGSKALPVLTMDKRELMHTLWRNFKLNLLMFHVKGDGVFRVNVVSAPQLDRISGLVVFLGMLYFIFKRQFFKLFYVMAMLFFLQLPSISPAILEGEIPHSGRVIALTPYVYLLVAAGLYGTFRFMQWLGYKVMITSLIVAILGGLIVYDNTFEYFVTYARGLPDGNLSPGKYLAQAIDTYPASYHVYFSMCCWGNMVQPEPKAVIYQLKEPKWYENFDYYVGKCADIQKKPAIVVAGPRDPGKMMDLIKCGGFESVQSVVTLSGREVGNLLLFK